jgi:hypothetical protein
MLHMQAEDGHAFSWAVRQEEARNEVCCLGSASSRRSSTTRLTTQFPRPHLCVVGEFGGRCILIPLEMETGTRGCVPFRERTT